MNGVLGFVVLGGCVARGGRIGGRWDCFALNDPVYCMYHFVPGTFQFGIKELATVGKAKIFAGRPTAAFYPAVVNHASVFEACE